MALRLGSLLKISNPTAGESVDIVEYEHTKRVWWTSVCMDLMTCTELSLAPACRIDDIVLQLPDDSQLPTADDDFNAALYLTAQVNLCRLKHRTIETALDLRVGNIRDAYTLIEPCFQGLRQWKANFFPTLEFSEHTEFTNATLALPTMRTVASMLMRYNQVFVLPHPVPA